MTIGRLFAEGYRLQLMRGLEQELEGLGFARIGGVDEAGRGALAGPVVAAAVVMRSDRLVPGVDDSKSLPAPRREALASAVREAALSWQVVAVSAADIDRVNILQATRRAMREAVLGLDPRPSCLLTDAVALRDLPFPCLPVVRGDCISYAIACASILAKVERDRLLGLLDADYPHYGFAGNKGYGAPEHLAALGHFGPSPVHRLTFRSVVPRRAEGAR